MLIAYIIAAGITLCGLYFLWKDYVKYREELFMRSNRGEDRDGEDDPDWREPQGE